MSPNRNPQRQERCRDWSPWESSRTSCLPRRVLREPLTSSISRRSRHCRTALSCGTTSAVASMWSFEPKPLRIFLGLKDQRANNFIVLCQASKNTETSPLQVSTSVGVSDILCVWTEDKRSKHTCHPVTSTHLEQCWPSSCTGRRNGQHLSQSCTLTKTRCHTHSRTTPQSNKTRTTTKVHVHDSMT